jgi:hypothetical protein
MNSYSLLVVLFFCPITLSHSFILALSVFSDKLLTLILMSTPVKTLRKKLQSVDENQEEKGKNTQ